MPGPTAAPATASPWQRIRTSIATRSPCSIRSFFGPETPRFRCALRRSATRVPPPYVLARLRQRGAELALGPNRVAGIHLGAPAADDLRDRARHSGALEVARRAPPQVMEQQARHSGARASRRQIIAQYRAQAARANGRREQRLTRAMIEPPAHRHWLSKAEHPRRDDARALQLCPHYSAALDHGGKLRARVIG